MRTGALICAPDDEDDDCRGAEEDDCGGAACCAPTVPTTTMVALRTPTTFWNCRTRLCEIDADDSAAQNLVLQFQNVVGVRKATMVVVGTVGAQHAAPLQSSSSAPLQSSSSSSGAHMSAPVRIYYEK